MREIFSIASFIHIVISEETVLRRMLLYTYYISAMLIMTQLEN